MDTFTYNELTGTSLAELTDALAEFRRNPVGHIATSVRNAAQSLCLDWITYLAGSGDPAAPAMNQSVALINTAADAVEPHFLDEAALIREAAAYILEESRVVDDKTEPVAVMVGE